LSRENKKKRILIELPTWLGDIVMTSPAIENLRLEFAECNIDILGYNKNIEIYKNHPNVKDLFVVNKKYKDILKFAFTNNKRYDFFISFRSSLRSNILKLFLLSKKKIKFNKSLYTKGHLVERYNNFINQSLEINRSPGSLKIYHLKEPLERLKPFICLNPGASYGSAKCWPPENFAKLAIKMSGHFDVVIVGSKNESNLSEIIESQIKTKIRNYQNLTGKTSIAQLVNLISQATVFVTGDSGSMHISAAFDVPSINIFGPTKTDETRPWHAKKSIILKKELNCSPCMKRECPLGHNNCMKLVEVDEVISAINSII